MMFVLGSKCKSQIFSKSIARGTTWPALRTRYSRTWNSRGNSFIHLPPRFAVRDTRSSSRSPTRKSFKTRQEFGESKRFDQVIITAGAETANPVIYLPESAYDQCRRADP